MTLRKQSPEGAKQGNSQPEGDNRSGGLRIAEKGIYALGIDPGVNTGLAWWNKERKCFDQIETVKIHEAMKFILQEPDNINHVYIEQPPQNYAARNQFRAQGAGSIKRDFGIWVDFLRSLKIPYTAINAKNNRTKLSAVQFKKSTGYENRTNEHGRDAAMLVFGR